MRYSLFFMIIGILQVTAAVGYSQTARLTIDMQEATVAQVIAQIENESQFYFTYNTREINPNRIVSIQVNETDINTLLNQLFADEPVNYLIVDKHVVLYKEGTIAYSGNAQQGIAITGVITDPDGEPLPGATVKMKGSTQGTVTDSNGNYSLSVPDANATLVFSYIGYATQEIQVGNQRVINVKLQEDTHQIEEVVVVGYGVQRVATMTGSVSQIKTDKVTVAPIANVTNLLAGQLPGLITKQISGVPGQDGASLRIRSFEGNPLMIVDGMENSFENLDASQIETISILKDGAASIYGARAGNGVILITTKRGSQSKPTVSVNSSYTLQGSTRVYKPSSSAQRAQLQRDMWLNIDGNDPALAPFTEEEIELYKRGTDPNYPNTDWFDASIRRYAPQQNHNLTVSGGTETIKYSGYFGYNSQETILKTNGGYFDRYNFQVNIDAKVTKQITISMDIKHFKEKRYYPAGANSIGGNNNYFWGGLIYSADPAYPLTIPDPSKWAYAGVTYGNPVWATNSEFSGYQDRQNKNTVYKGELKYDFKYVPGLNLKGSVSLRNDDYQYKNVVNQESFYIYNAAADIYTMVRKSQDAMQINMTASNTTRLVQQYSLNYNNTFLNVHTVSGMLLYEWQKDTYSSFSTSRSGFLSMALDEFFAGDASTASNNSSTSAMGRVSWVGRLNYSFKDRYMMETILRADASSRFADGYRWGYFPSVSLGWNIAQENFMSQMKSLDQLKLRMSYGSSGYDGVANFAFLTGYRFDGTYTIGSNLLSGLMPTDLANFALSWETMRIYDVGLDFSLWKRKLYGEFDYFYRERNGIPATRRGSLPDSFGAGLPVENLNSQSTAGFELKLGTSGMAGNLYYDISGNFNYGISKWIKYDEAEYTDPDEIRLYKNTGKAIDRRYGYIFDGLFTSQEEINQWPITYDVLNNSNAVLRPGDAKYKDLNGDGVINWRDQKEIGKGATPHGTFGLNINLKYKNFDFSTLFQGAFDYNTKISWDYRVNILYDDYWHATRNNKADALEPRPGGASPNGFGSDYRNRTTSYMRLKYISVGYSIPASILSQIGVEKCRFYLAGTNFFTISNLNKYGLDPEMPESYSAGFYYPQQFTMSVGCNFTF